SYLLPAPCSLLPAPYKPKTLYLTEVQTALNAYYKADPSVPGKMYTRFFGISPRDTVSLDPEHRLLLEVS
ncbi:hypothetical protein, partial [Moorena sp. SIO3I6]|uniref:hypothetical protein n=1 Tax=Moorena sp. SIO3I6 TaxID=2607831 RepID=UPI0013FBF584